MKIGKIIPNGVSLEKHENDTVVYFTDLGYDIELRSHYDIVVITEGDLLSKSKRPSPHFFIHEEYRE